MTNKQYTHIKNDYELTFDVNSKIEACADDQDIKSINYDFVKIGNLVNVEPNATVDILAVVRSASDVSEIISQKLGGKTLKKRDLTIVDDSECEVSGWLVGLN